MLQIQKYLSHRKTVSNNNTKPEYQQNHNMSQKSQTKRPVQKTSAQQLITRLASLKALRKMVLQPSQSKLRTDLTHYPQYSTKRIRTEGNDKQSFQNATQSPKKQRDDQSASPLPSYSKPPFNIIKTLLTHNASPQPNSDSKRIVREMRNQSADFQNVFPPKETSKLKQNCKKKFNSYGSLNDHVYFTQRGQYINYIDAYHQNQKKSPQQNLRPCNSQKHLTTQQFKDKLSNLQFIKQNIIQSSEKTQKVRKQLSNEGGGSTLKKPTSTIPLKLYDDSGKRNRTENSQPSGVQSRQSFVRELDNDEPLNDGYQILSSIQERSLEQKIDMLASQVHLLKKKSDQLEMQNKMLFENLYKIQEDKECNSEDRGQLVSKLDQMILMQRRQEDNLNYFKQMFQLNSNERRIKTEQFHNESVSNGNQKDSQQHRPLVKSEYAGIDFNI